MYVSEKERVLFVHVPKTGGSAIRGLMQGFEMRREGGRHNTLKELPNAKAYRDWRVFGVVRHPYDRMISMYRFQIVNHHIDPAKHTRRWGSLIREESPLRSFHDFVKNRIENGTVPVQQFDFFSHPILKPEVFKYEEDAHNQIREYLGIEKELVRDETTHYFGSYKREDWSDPEGLALIRKHCWLDFEKYGYEP